MKCTKCNEKIQEKRIFEELGVSHMLSKSLGLCVDCFLSTDLGAETEEEDLFLEEMRGGVYEL